MTQETLNVVTAIAESISAIGTVGAIIVALYLALRDESVRLRISTSIYVLVTPGVPNSSRSMFGFFVTNVGRRPAALSSIELRVGLVRKARFTVIFDQENPFCTKLPAMISDGQQATFVMPMSDFKDVVRDVRKAVGKRLDRHFASIVVHSYNGKEKSVRLSGGLLKEYRRIMAAGPDRLSPVFSSPAPPPQ